MCLWLIGLALARSEVSAESSAPGSLVRYAPFLV